MQSEKSPDPRYGACLDALQEKAQELVQYIDENKKLRKALQYIDENKKLREALRWALQAENHIIVTGRGVLRCKHCDRENTMLSGIIHLPDCLYTKAKALLDNKLVKPNKKVGEDK